MSAIITTVLIVMMIIFAMGFLWVVVVPFIEGKIHATKVMFILMDERMSVYGVSEGVVPNVLDITITRGMSKLTEFDIVNITETVYYETPIPTDIYLLVDLSGSMGFLVNGGEGSYVPLDILIDSTHDFVDTILDLNNDSQIALMGFRDSSNVNYQPDYPYLDFTNDSALLNMEINSWEADGGTYLLTGMQKTYDNFLLGSESENKILIILGDGDCTGSGCSQDSIDYAVNFNDMEITTHTIGFGPNANTALFAGIAANGGGDYHDSSEFNDLAIVFRDIIGKTNVTEMVSKEVSIPGIFLDIVVFSGGESNTYRINREVPGSNEKKKYSIDLANFTDDWEAEAITKIDIYLIGVSEGGEYNSVLMDSYDDFEWA